jgi:hypothetical protein
MKIISTNEINLIDITKNFATMKLTLPGLSSTLAGAYGYVYGRAM